LHFRDGDSTELSGEDIPAGLFAAAIPVEQMLPCVGQAAIGIEIRTNDPRVEKICAALNDPTTHACVTAERAFLQGMGGGCQLAVGAFAETTPEQLHLRAISFLSSMPRKGERSGKLSEAAAIGEALARELR
jgi:hydroxymethylbilane synthase